MRLGAGLPRPPEIELSTLPTPSVNGTERLAGSACAGCCYLSAPSRRDVQWAPGLMQRPELIPARLLAALVTPEFHRGEGFSRLFLDSPWPSGRLLTLPATILAIPQVLHLPISLGIHLHRGVIEEPGRIRTCTTCLWGESLSTCVQAFQGVPCQSHPDALS